MRRHNSGTTCNLHVAMARAVHVGLPFGQMSRRRRPIAKMSVSLSPLLPRPLVAFAVLFQFSSALSFVPPIIPDATPGSTKSHLLGGARRQQGRRRWLDASSLLASSSATSASTSFGDDEISNSGGIYRPFAEYAWTRLKDTGLFDGEGARPVPKDLASNSSPARGMAEGTEVTIEVRSMVGRSSGPIRLARYALLETLAPPTPTSDLFAVPDAIHVLNLVVFPSPNIIGCPALPVLGLDLVTLPGMKHLIAIDFQPVLPLPSKSDGDESEEGDETNIETERIVLPKQYGEFEARLAALHRKHCVESDALPWGGDIPEFARRFFSPYAVWTRLAGEEALPVVQDEVMSVFGDYVKLYVDLMQRVQRDVGSEALNLDNDHGNPDAVQGQTDYLNYRRDNDPARPMLKSLYGEEWTEKLIGEILFRDIQ